MCSNTGNPTENTYQKCQEPDNRALRLSEFSFMMDSEMDRSIRPYHITYHCLISFCALSVFLFGNLAYLGLANLARQTRWILFYIFYDIKHSFSTLSEFRKPQFILSAVFLNPSVTMK